LFDHSRLTKTGIYIRVKMEDQADNWYGMVQYMPYHIVSLPPPPMGTYHNLCDFLGSLNFLSFIIIMILSEIAETFQLLV